MIRLYISDEGNFYFSEKDNLLKYPACYGDRYYLSNHQVNLSDKFFEVGSFVYIVPKDVGENPLGLGAFVVTESREISNNKYNDIILRFNEVDWLSRNLRETYQNVIEEELED